MKKYLLVLTLLIFWTLGKSQTFSFVIKFVDNIGNKDSIILGYDSQATDTIDASFNETNIYNVALNPNFDVRISNLWDLAVTSLSQTPFQSKKQILFASNCATNVATIDIKCKNWPVTAYWDKLPFSNSCVNGTLLTSVNPGGWFDTGTNSSMGTVALKSTDSVIFSTNTTPNEADGFFNYLNNNGDTIPAFWFTFADSSIFTVGLPIYESANNYSVYPNPTKEIINIPRELAFSNLKDAVGNLVQVQNDNLKLNISNLSNGFYILTCINNKGIEMKFKVFKE